MEKMENYYNFKEPPEMIVFMAMEAGMSSGEARKLMFKLYPELKDNPEYNQ